MHLTVFGYSLSDHVIETNALRDVNGRIWDQKRKQKQNGNPLNIFQIKPY